MKKLGESFLDEMREVIDAAGAAPDVQHKFLDAMCELERATKRFDALLPFPEELERLTLAEQNSVKRYALAAMKLAMENHARAFSQGLLLSLAMHVTTGDVAH